MLIFGMKVAFILLACIVMNCVNLTMQMDRNNNNKQQPV